jgi:hypothetical protein
VRLWRKDPAQARAYLTHYTAECAEAALHRASSLLSQMP